MDPISNMLTAIINAQRVNKERVAVPYSNFNLALAEFLQQQDLVVKLRVQDGKRKRVVITLAYDNREPVIQSLKRLSKPGNRKYVTSEELPFTGNRPGIYVLSTSSGLMNGEKARSKGLGGELLCEIWRNK
jgi:small subunit ribosomal protein S8